MISVGVPIVAGSKIRDGDEIVPWEGCRRASTMRATTHRPLLLGLNEANIIILGSPSKALERISQEGGVCNG